MMKTHRVVFLCFLAILVQSCATPAKQPLGTPKAPPLSSETQFTDSERISGAPETKFPDAETAPLDATASPTDRAVAISGNATPSKKPATKASLPSIQGRVATGLLSPGRGAPTQEAIPGTDRQRIVLNYDKADVSEVVSQIFADYLKINYVLDPTLQGRISLYLEGDFTKQEFFHMVTKALEANNISVVPQNGLYSVQPIQRSASSSLPIADAAMLQDKAGNRPVIVIYRLRFMDVKQAINTIRFFLTPGRPITSDTLTNSIIFVESSDNASSIVGVLKALDVDVLQEVSMEIVPLQALAPQDAVQSMENLMGKLNLFQESAVRDNIAFIPLQNYGGVLVLARNPDLLKTAKYWISALDVQGAEAGEQVYVYFVQNGLALDIGNILNQVFGLGGPVGRPGQQIVSATRTPFGTGGGVGFGSGTFGGRSSFGTGGTSGRAFGTGRSSFGTGMGGTASGLGAGTGVGGTTGVGTAGVGSRGGRITTGQTGQLGQAGRTPGAGTGAQAQPFGPGQTLTGEVVIIPDEINNAIVVKANAQDYAKIRKTIETLDILPRAVLIEVLVAEVRLTKDLQYGLEWFFNEVGVDMIGGKNGRMDVKHGGNITPGLNLDAVGSPGLSLFWGTLDNKVNVLLNLLSTKTDFNILSTPTLLASDNKEASITVGGREPIALGPSFSTGTTVDVGGDTVVNNVVSSISYEETGLLLNVIPHINAGGLIRMELELTDRRTGAPATIGNNQQTPTFTERNIRTTLLAQNGSTVVIGGIILQQDTDTKNGIPGLENIPILSPLFSTKTKRRDRTELLIAITPHVVDHSKSGGSLEFIDEIRKLKRRIEKP